MNTVRKEKQKKEKVEISEAEKDINVFLHKSILKDDEVLKELQEEHVECPICLEQYEENDIVVHLKCAKKHTFHKSCLAEFLASATNRKECPLCRNAIKVPRRKPKKK